MAKIENNEKTTTCEVTGCTPKGYGYEVGFCIVVLVIIVLGAFAGLSGQPLVNIG